MTIQTSRRTFLQGSAALGAALVVGFDAKGALAAAEMAPNPFVRINADGTVTVIAKHFEMGQGTTTGLATLIAEELDADWDAVHVEYAPADGEKYGNLLFGAQGTGGSTAIANSWDQYRKAGAAARMMLEQAAAERWGVTPGSVTVYNGVVRSGANSATFADLVADAAVLTPPAEPVLKPASRYRYIGNAAIRRKDSPEKTDGSAIFALDTHLPDMVVAVLARSPKAGGTLVSFDDTETRKVKGVVDVRETPKGVAVYATNTWAAIKGREALTAEWDFANAENRGTDAIFDDLRAMLDEPGLPAREAEGDIEAALEGAEIVEAEYSFPMLAHAPLEALNCTIEPGENGVIVHDGCQFPGIAQPTIAGVLGIAPQNVQINTVLAGGSFGRRANTDADYHVEAAFAFKALGGERPVKLVWTREDDIAGGYYRPPFVHRVRAGVKDGAIAGWHHAIAGGSIAIGTPFEAIMVHGGVDHTSVEGIVDTPYAVPMMAVEAHNLKTPVKMLWWRSVGHTHTAYVMETMMDKLAEAAGVDPVEFRLAMLKDQPRMAGALKLAAEKAGWGEEMGEGRGRGVAVHKSFNSYVALVADVTVTDGDVKLDRIVAGVDCGIAVNPDVIKAQIEGAIGYGLGAAMRNKITMTDGVVDQSNYPDYELLRITDMPVIETHIVASAEAPTGIGEPGLPPAAPAVANAIAAATGQRLTHLPFTDEGISFV